MDNSVVGLSHDKMQKLSTFRINANLFLAQTSQRSMALGQAVKFLHAARFNVEKAEDILKNYEKHKVTYGLENLHTHRQRLNSEIRTKKLEILGVRDPEGSQLLLFTASKHDSKSCDHKTSMQLLFLILDQISESQETQSKGVTLIVDIRDCSFSSYDFKYTSQMLSVLHEGYPLYLKMVFIVEAPLWFKHHPNLHPMSAMQRDGKLKMVGLQDLQKHLPDSTLPPSLGGSLLPSRAVTATAGALALESPVRSTTKKLPMAPPRQRPPPERRQSFPDMATLETNRQAAQPPAGAVNRMKDLFEQKKDMFEQKKDEHTVVSPQRRPHNGVSKPNPPPSKPIKMLPVPPQRTQAAANSVRSDAHHKGDKGRGKVALTVLNIGSNNKSSADKSKSDFKTASAGPSSKPASAGPSSKPASAGPSSKPVSAGPSSKPAPTGLASDRPLPLSSSGGDKKKPVYSEYETVEITPMPLSPTKPRSSKRSTPAAPPASSKPRDHQAPPTSKPPPIRPIDPPSAASSKPPPVRSIEPHGSSKPSPIRPIEPPVAASSSKPSPPKSQYENIQIKRTGYDDTTDSSSDDEGGEVLGIGSIDEVIYENFGPDEGHRWMTAHELQQYVSNKGKKGLSAEYYKIKNEPLTGSYEAFKVAESCKIKKNRYRDVVCYDETRVVLSTISGVPGSDYIHANYVNGYKKPKAFIVTQGPMKKTVDDFWRMLWEQHVFVVVMTTKCVELGKLKCAQYWPDGSDLGVYGGVAVSCTRADHRDHYVVRTLRAQYKGDTRTVVHYQFISWPDYGVPRSSDAVFSLVYAAREMQGRFPEYVTNHHQFPVHGPPMVVHCSAGIGRSGTLAALDYCIDELREKSRVNVQHAVRQLRAQRAFSIQTDEQYEFTYQTVRDYALSLKASMR